MAENCQESNGKVFVKEQEMQDKRAGQPNLDVATVVTYDEEEWCLELDTVGVVVHSSQADFLSQVVEHFKEVQELAAKYTTEGFGSVTFTTRAAQVMLRWLEDKERQNG